jgi:hypothetical protein
MTRGQTIAASLLGPGLATFASVPAWAAGFDAPPEAVAVMGLSLFLLLGVPAMGFGYALAGFLTLKVSLGCVLVLALVPTAFAWITRGLDMVTALAPFQLALLVMLGPLFVLGWWIGHRDV